MRPRAVGFRCRILDNRLFILNLSGSCGSVMTHDSFISGDGRVIYSFESLITLRQPSTNRRGRQIHLFFISAKSVIRFRNSSLAGYSSLSFMRRSSWAKVRLKLFLFLTVFSFESYGFSGQNLLPRAGSDVELFVMSQIIHFVSDMVNQHHAYDHETGQCGVICVNPGVSGEVRPVSIW